MAALAASVAATIAGMKRVINQDRAPAYRHSGYMQTSNQGNKLKRKAEYLPERDGVHGSGSGSSWPYKEVVNHAGYNREILFRNEPVDDKDFAADDIGDVDDSIDAKQAESETNPYIDIQLEELLMPLTSPADLPTHSSLAYAYNTTFLSDMAQEACEVAERERKQLARAKRLMTRLRGDYDWMPCNLSQTPYDQDMFNTMTIYDKIIASVPTHPDLNLETKKSDSNTEKGGPDLNTTQSDKGKMDSDPNRKQVDREDVEAKTVTDVVQSPAHAENHASKDDGTEHETVIEDGKGDGQEAALAGPEVHTEPHSYDTAETAAPAQIQDDQSPMDCVSPAMADDSAVEAQSNLNTNADTNLDTNTCMNLDTSSANVPHNPNKEMDPPPAQSSEKATSTTGANGQEKMTEQTGTEQNEKSEDKPKESNIEMSQHDTLAKPDETKSEARQTREASNDDSAAIIARPSQSPPPRRITRAKAQANKTNTATTTTTATATRTPSPSPSVGEISKHPLFLIPQSVKLDDSFGLPADEAEETRRMLAAYVQKQEEVCRGAERLHQGLLEADRHRHTVMKWSKAEAHIGEMSDGEDWYDWEEWQLTEPLHKGHAEEEEEIVAPGKKTRGRRA